MPLFQVSGLVPCAEAHAVLQVGEGFQSQVRSKLGFAAATARRGGQPGSTS